MVGFMLVLSLYGSFYVVFVLLRLVLCWFCLSMVGLMLILCWFGWFYVGIIGFVLVWLVFCLCFICHFLCMALFSCNPLHVAQFWCIDAH